MEGAYLAIRRCLAILFDSIGAIIFLAYSLIVAPLGVLRGADRVFTFMRVLLPHGLMTAGLRATLDWKIGNLDRAIAQLEGLIGYLEETDATRMSRLSKRLVLADLYSLMARAYLRSGHVDDAMLVIIRAQNSLDVKRLRGIGELDAKTAHIVRAGIAAGRLLDGGGLATMLVRSTQDAGKFPLERRKRNRNPNKMRQGASYRDKNKKKIPRPNKKPVGTDGTGVSADGKKEHQGAQVIPFPGI